MNTLEIKLTITNDSNTLETITMPECIYDISKKFGKYTIEETRVYNEHISLDIIWLNRNGNKSICLVSPNIEDVKESFRLLAKNKNRTEKLMINDELNITSGEYWQQTDVGLSTISGIGGIVYTYSNNTNAITTNKKEELKMKGIEAKVIAKVATINEKTKRVNTGIVYGSNIVRVSEEERKAIIDGEIVRDIYNLVVDSVEIINTDKPRLEVVDNRIEFAKLKADLSYHNMLWTLGVETEKEYNLKKTEIELEFEKISGKVEYNLIWYGDK